MNPYESQSGATNNPLSSESSTSKFLGQDSYRWVWLSIAIILGLVAAVFAATPLPFILFAVCCASYAGARTSVGVKKGFFLAPMVRATLFALICGFLAGFFVGVKETFGDLHRILEGPIDAWWTSYPVRQSIARALAGLAVGACAGVMIGSGVGLAARSKGAEVSLKTAGAEKQE